jgi:proteasome lid subunit RPN8/RPN11
MAFKVITTDEAWRGFLTRAKKNFPTEHCEALWGVATLDSFRITDFKRMRVAFATNTRLVDYDDAEVKRQKWLAQKAGKEFLGTVHTHPWSTADTCGSTKDHHEAAKDGERIMGVVALYKKKGRFVIETEWWFPQPKIEFELLPE